MTTIPARDIGALKKAIAKARERFGVSPICRISSCYEAGRDGFWLDRLLKQLDVNDVVVDSASIQVSRRAPGVQQVKERKMLIQRWLPELPGAASYYSATSAMSATSRTRGAETPSWS